MWTFSREVCLTVCQTIIRRLPSACVTLFNGMSIFPYFKENLKFQWINWLSSQALNLRRSVSPCASAVTGCSWDWHMGALLPFRLSGRFLHKQRWGFSSHRSPLFYCCQTVLFQALAFLGAISEMKWGSLLWKVAMFSNLGASPVVCKPCEEGAFVFRGFVLEVTPCPQHME